MRFPFAKTRNDKARESSRTRFRPEFLSDSLERRDLMAALVPGGIVSGSVSTVGEVDSWTFNGTYGQVIELITTSTSNQSGYSTYAEIFRPDGSRIQYVPTMLNKQLTLNATGTFKVTIRDDNNRETGNYTIGLESISPASPSAVNIPKGSIVSGSISVPTQKDQWTFNAKAGDAVELITATQGTFAAYTEVFAPNGQRVVYMYAATNRRIDILATGTYVVQVRDYYLKNSGNYTLGLESLSPASSDAVSLTSGREVSGKIDATIQKDQWLINVPAGRQLKITLSGTAIDNGFRPYIDLISPSGGSCGSMEAGTKTFAINTAGTYILQMRDYSYFKRGSYRMTATIV